MMDKANNAAQAANASVQEGDQQMKANTQEAADAVKSTDGAHK
ncbi:hypothetical protein MtrunA17_Chr7g0221361 [Medicago truncatula]|nr:hypothetical protein MtrunA17_Chr7g0221361 [Medicago truncatula]